ncbi:sodium:proline symporter [Micractinium conductrix]|uniref:Sodium:proline symporter n=1 Tax=Micractinium conductrix TaxID=554055 RepID=A0A2P6VG68_9CHLO|nr:sodium:proline symporter [Micractinium conductrix]|eukprot:PSC73068.1 sodium:proline symporter [Micractinium conductrix]
MTAANRPRSGRIHPDGGSPPPEEAVGTKAAVARALTRVPTVVRRGFVQKSLREHAEEQERAKGLHLPDDEYAAWLAGCARREGREGTVDNLGFYLHMIAPMLCIALMYFTVFSLMAWAVPNHLCNTVAKENSASSFGFQNCINNDLGQEGDYSTRTGSKVFWLLYWTMISGWATGFNFYVVWVMMGKAYTNRERLYGLVISLMSMSVLPVLGPVYGYSFMHVSAAASQSSRWYLLNAFGGFGIVSYRMLIPLMVTGRAGDSLGGMGLTITRVIVHPAVWGLMSMWFRFVLRHIGYIHTPMRAIVFLAWPYLYNQMYGRFLLLQLDSVGSVLVMNLIFACFDLAGKLSDRASDSLLLKLLYGERGRDALTALRDTDDRHMTEVFTSWTFEMSSIFAASAILSFGGVASSPGVGPDHKMIWYNAGAQAATTLVFGFLGLVLEGKFHEYDWRKSWPKEIWKIVLLFVPIAFIGGTWLIGELLLIFCPVYYPDQDRVLLEQCDKPSLFQAGAA